ncbi:membrane protein insertase YidC [Streptococcus tangpeifui]|uniref:membrane protein insertase YidC n=1 Tax=Streptococcus tangpeifui TaxID=2709400 RepID=UPI0013EC7DDB|nr:MULTISPECIES: membrane protein insertase YidC [unclassified Streptococcus]
MNKTSKRILLSGIALSMLFVLSGCVRLGKNGKPTGTVWHLLGEPMGHLITFFANNLGLGFGLGIILVTVLVRLLILPLGLHQSRSAAYQAAKRDYLAPIFEPINKKMKEATTQEEKMAAQTELMQAQRENGVSMLGGMGCLPLLIQIPFFSAMYFAARYTPGVLKSDFLWFNLGHRDIPLMIIIAGLYLVQSWLAVKQMPEEQRKQAGMTMYMTPIMMVFFGLAQPSAVVLYWFVGGIFSIIQQLITNFLIKPKLAKQVEEEFKKNPPKAPKAAKAARKDVTPQNQTNKAITTKKQNRNAGKQNRKKK